MRCWPLRAHSSVSALSSGFTPGSSTCRRFHVFLRARSSGDVELFVGSRGCEVWNKWCAGLLHLAADDYHTEMCFLLCSLGLIGRGLCARCEISPFQPGNSFSFNLTGCSAENPGSTVLSLCKNGTPPAAAIFGEIQRRCNKRQILVHLQRACTNHLCVSSAESVWTESNPSFIRGGSDIMHV